MLREDTYRFGTLRWRTWLLVGTLALGTTILTPSGMRLWSELRKQGSSLVSLDEVPGELLPEILWRFKPNLPYARVVLVGTGIEEIWFIRSTTPDGELYYTFGAGEYEMTPPRFISAWMLERLRRGLWTNQNLVEVRIGWPARSFVGRYYDLRADGKSWTYEGATGLPDWIIRLTRSGSRVDLPFKPIWPGFLLNLLFFVCIWAVAIWSVPIGKMIFRKYLGRCSKCGYDLRGAPSCGCPECGWKRKEEDAQQPA